MFDHKPGEYAMRRFKRAKIDVRTGSIVKEVNPHGFFLVYKK